VIASSLSIEMPSEFRCALPIDKIEKRLTLRVPGSTANLGPAFDTIGLALKVHSWLDFCVLERADKSVPLIRRCGAIAKQLPSDQLNLIYKILAKSIADPTLLERIRISVYSDIPLERGMGSSGSVIIGTIYAAMLFNGEKPVTEELLAKASEFESHIDNLSASLLGGLVVSHKSEQELITTTLKWPQAWKLLVLVPSFAVSTAKSRAVLPEKYARADVVENLQRVALITTAICHENPELFKLALKDKIHEPYRLQLIPQLADLRKALLDKPVLGSALSGAGSAMLVIVEQEHHQHILQFLKTWAAKQTTDMSVFETSVDTDGLTVITDC